MIDDYKLKDHRKWLKLASEEKVYRDTHISMGSKPLADFMYALIMCHAEIITSYGVGIYEYSRKQNSRNSVQIRIKIHPEFIEEFKEISGCDLQELATYSLNCNQ